MAAPLSGAISVHDLLQVDLRLGIQQVFGQGSVPQWILESPGLAAFVHVRRGVGNNGQWIPVGIRGTSRSQRWGTLCHCRFIRSVTSAEQLLHVPIPKARSLFIPAFEALEKLKVRWVDLDLVWGPAGSVGFELLANREVTTPDSDLDIVIYAHRRIEKEEAADLCDRASDLPSRIDIRVETRCSGFLLREYADKHRTTYLLRTPSGEILDDDPWKPGA